mmetsp:Transcript_88768/g.287434  ORF Transcript_88768/g.287434 Transcript_88768/m.287434 type:complete len:256 (+) Transcript_88768:148-915(+)
MRLRVSVPVLSLQMVVALPMVSEASRRFTRFWSSFMREPFSESATSTASGRLAGWPETMMSMAVMRMMSNWLPTFRRNRKIAEATASSTEMPMPLASSPLTFFVKMLSPPRASRRFFSIRSSRLIGRPSSRFSSVPFFWLWISSEILPLTEFAPTAMMRQVPEPMRTEVPETRSGASSGSLGTSSGSPVRADSSHCTASPATSTASAASTEPALMERTSPTTRLWLATFTGDPSRSTGRYSVERAPSFMKSCSLA